MVRGSCDEGSQKNRNDIRRPCTRFCTEKPRQQRIVLILRIAKSITCVESIPHHYPIPTSAAKGSRFRLECRQPHSPACLSTAACVFTDRRNPKRSRCASRGSIRGIRPSTLARNKDSQRAGECQLERLGVQSPQSFIQDYNGAWKLQSQRQHFLLAGAQICHRGYLVQPLRGLNLQPG